MQFNRRKFLGAVAAGGLGAPGIVTSAFAQSDFPNKPITVICPFAPGSGADVFARFYARKLEQLAGVATIVENKTGAGGIIAAEYVARSKPDGYTIFPIPSVAVLATAPALFKSLPFDPIKDFEHVTTLHQTVLVLVVPASSPFKTAQDLIAHLKEKGEDAAYGSVSNLSRAISELFKSKFDLKTREVRFQNFPPALNEMNAGNLEFVFLDNGQATAHINAGRLRGLSQTSAERMPALPDIPGAREAGIPDMDISLFVALHTPKGVPAAIIDKYAGWFHQIIADEETQKFYATSGASPMPNSPAATQAIVEDAVKKWTDYIKLAKIEPQ